MKTVAENLIAMSTITDELPLPVYRRWFDAILSDDVATVTDILATCSGVDKFCLLGSRFRFVDPKLIDNFSGRNYKFTRPFTLAAVKRSFKVCDVMIKNGVDVSLTESGTGYNVLNCLVCAAFYCPDEEEKLAEVYVNLLKILSPDRIEKLLMAENVDQLRPIEMAAQQGTLNLIMSLWETPRVYVTREKVIDVSIYRWYDITEYENDDEGGRRFVSPL